MKSTQPPGRSDERERVPACKTQPVRQPGHCRSAAECVSQRNSFVKAQRPIPKQPQESLTWPRQEKISHCAHLTNCSAALPRGKPRTWPRPHNARHNAQAALGSIFDTHDKDSRCRKPRMHIGRLDVLHHPPCRGEQPVDDNPGLLLGREHVIALSSEGSLWVAMLSQHRRATRATRGARRKKVAEEYGSRTHQGLLAAPTRFEVWPMHRHATLFLVR